MTIRNKYHARKTTVNGIEFDSMAESRRYQELLLLQRAGEISGLELQPRFILQPTFRDSQGRTHRAIAYIADFEYVENGRRIVEDVKGGKATQTAEFRIKWKMAVRQYPDVEFRTVTQ
jgi:hypothetical protein